MRNTNSVIPNRVDLGQRSETVRRANLSAIVRTLHEHGPQSRSDLVAQTGLTRSAIRALVGELTLAGLVTEGRAAPLGRPGRPSPEVRLVPGSCVVIALDISVESLTAAIVGLGGTVLAFTRIDRPDGHFSPEAIVDDVVGLARDIVTGRPPRERIVGVGVAVAGVVRRRDGRVEMAPNLGWTGVPLGTLLARGLGVAVPIDVANEADLGVLAEHRRGAAVGVDDVLFVIGEVGVGGGIIADGRPLGGAAGYGGEIGHMSVNPIGSPCRCGSTGCWETEVGGEALLVRAGLPRDAGREGADAVLRDAEAGSPVALAAIEETGRWLGLGLATLVNIFNPRLVVLGGLFGRLYPFVGSAVARELGRRTLPAPLAMVRVVPATLGIDAPLLGAAEMALEPVLADPAAWFGGRLDDVEAVSA